MEMYGEHGDLEKRRIRCDNCARLYRIGPQ
jgi:hypothetical protein